MFEKKLDLVDKLSNNVFQSIFSLFSIFQKAKAELYLVGGCVRDLLLGKKPKDYDFCTNLTPDQVKELLSKEGHEVEFNEIHFLNPELEKETKEYNKYIKENNPQPIFICDYTFIDTGLKHGTITVHDKRYDMFYEITTYRIDGKYEDGRHPEEVIFTSSLEEDLKRRDFTINSFAYNLLENKLSMLDESFLRDLDYGIIRTVGDPNQRFSEDALRMLRALRFCAQLNFSIEENTYSAIKALNSKLTMISKERIRDELTKILLSDNPQLLELIVASNTEQYLFDGLTPLTDILNCEHQNPWHYTDVFHHTMDVVKRIPKTFVLRWAALFHDFGKPFTKALKEGTTDHYSYHGHEAVSVEIATKIMDILKFPNYEKELISKYVQYHDTDLVECKNSRFKKAVVDIGKDNFKDFIKLKIADAYAHRITKDTKYAVDWISKLYDRFSNLVIEDDALTVKDLDINGYDLMDLGLQGKEIGDCLNYLLDIVLEDSTQNKKELLINYAKEWRKA